MKRNVIIATLAAAGVAGGAVLAGTAFADDGDDRKPASRTLNAGADDAGSDDRDDRDDRSGSKDGKGSGGSWISAEQAIGQALKAEPGHAHKLELEDDDRVWEVDILTEDGKWRQVDVARKGGEVVSSRADDDDDRNERTAKQVRAVLADAKTSLADAARIANERVPGTIEEIDLEKRGTVWKVDFEKVDGRDDDDDVELHVNVESGKATVHDDDRDDRDDRDDDRDDRDDDRDDRDDDRDDRDDDRDDKDDDRDDRDDDRDDKDDDRDDRDDD
ncbi:PepSY domain-containing protein [Streptomyces sp. XM4193]|uniref:PepSY domain-containing protein n=1 Tax=Streptomyces sp. XM4193 TaxID=2929782 RepID=UPI001FF75C87|nr:PepSY domain-containing protein [Streptomyces sp. XM4193]MCK1797523.1 PepSY domain-containing protein [Streptomyces sp. XM4193]